MAVNKEKENMEQEELTAEEKRSKVQARTDREVQPVFQIKPFAKGQQVTLFDLKKATQVSIPNANIAVRSLNKQHVEALKIAYQRAAEEKGEKLPPLELLNTTHGVVIIAGNHRNQAMRDIVAENLGYVDKNGALCIESELPKDALPEFNEALKHTLVNYVPAKNVQSLVDLEDLNDRIFLNNLTHGLPPSGENRSRYAIYMIARAERRGEKLTQQQAADIVHVSRVAVARQIMRDKGTVGITKRSILPADYEAEPEAQDVMEIVKEEIDDKKKVADPLQDASLALFRSLKSIKAEMDKGIKREDLPDYWDDILGTKLSGFKIDAFAFESILTAIDCLFPKNGNQ